MRFSAAFIATALAIGLAPACAQEVDQQTRQQIEAIHTKWVEAINKGDVDTLSAIGTPDTLVIDAFGRSIGPPNPEIAQMIQKKGITASFPIDGVQPIKGGQAAAYGTFTTKFTDPKVPPGQGNWLQLFERDGDSWKLRVYTSTRATLAAPK
jgi:ketosteroid isomerase-like protein